MRVKYVGKNFKAPMNGGTIEISQNENGNYNFGVLPETMKASLFENPQYSWIEDMTFAELKEFKKVIVSLIEQVEKDAEDMKE